MTGTGGDGRIGTLTTGIADRAYRLRHAIVRIHLFGSMRATSCLGDDVLPRGKKARAALAYFCLSQNGRVSRTRIATMLWDRVSADQARTNFHQVLFELTSAMSPLAAEIISIARAT